MEYTLRTMRFLLSFALFFTLVAFPLTPAHAADVFANSMYSSSSNVLTPGNAIGAPDGAYADFRDGGSSIILDLGEGEEGTGDIALNVYLINYGASYYVTLYDADWVDLGSSGDTIAIGSTSVIATYEGTTPYRYVKVASPNSAQWRLDAVEIFALANPVIEEDATVTEEPTGEGAEPPAASYTQGTLIKSSDSSAVYILGLDGDRHAFPTEREFTSWALSFDDVETVDDRTIAAYDLGANVTIRPGTYLMKLQTNPKVFAVEPGGVLRWVSTEAVALQLYGADWAKRVVDVSDAFWGNYTVGEDVDSAVHPDGTIIIRDGLHYYVADGSKAYLSDADADTLRFYSDVAVTTNSAIFNQYVDTVASLLTEGMTWPY